MSDESLIKYIASSIRDIKKTLDTIDKRQQEHFNDLIAITKDVEFQKKELERIDGEKDGKIDHIWDEIRRRDKKQMRLTSLIVSVGAIVATIANFFITK